MKKETKDVVEKLEKMKRIHKKALSEDMSVDPVIVDLKAEIDNMSVYAEAQIKLEAATDNFDKDEIDACMLEIERLVGKLKRKFCEDIFDVAVNTLQEIADEERELEDFEIRIMAAPIKNSLPLNDDQRNPVVQALPSLEKEVRTYESPSDELIKRVLVLLSCCTGTSIRNDSVANSKFISNADKTTSHATRYARRS